VPGCSRVVVLAAGAASSGIPAEWAAGEATAGVAFLADLSEATIGQIAEYVGEWSRPGDVVVLSVHWGPNWGYRILPEHRRFARALIERAGVDVVHGHSSHHPLGLEVHCERLILYGCGDLITDYEGIHGHEQYRGELGVLYLPTFNTRTGAVERIELIPTKMERFRLTRPPDEDVRWLAATLDRESSPLGTRVATTDDATLLVDW
jgi:poly-gamma-glutamate capsule biosynthesis protein CapA/YwtB (metallophosphatase superfamily)